MDFFKKRRKVNIIPLGQNCMPRTILTRWKVKPSKIMGEVTYPFDLAVFGMPEITKSLKTDFYEFFDDLEYTGKYWIKAPNCIEFSHDKNLGIKDKEKLVSLYKKRIKNFWSAMFDDTPILFVQILGDDEDVYAQYAQLLRLRPNKPFKIALIDTQDIIKEEIKYDDICLLKLPYPKEDYKQNWWRKDYYNSKEGKRFEKQIADFCRNIAEDLEKKQTL